MPSPTRLILLLAFASVARADLLTLTSGLTVEGVATEQGDVIEMKVPEGLLRYRKDVVASLKRGPVKAAPPKPVVVEKPAPAKKAPAGVSRPANDEVQDWFARQRERIAREQAAQARPKVTFEGGNPKCKSYEIYYGPGGKP